MESVEQQFNGNVDYGKILTSTISRKGDLITKMYLQVETTQASHSDGNVWWVNGFGHALVKRVELEIGGNIIYTHISEWMDIWSELTVTPENRPAYDKMVGYYNSETGLKHNNSTPLNRYYIPLQFWFCRNPGLALPIIALQYHDVKINTEFNDLRIH